MQYFLRIAGPYREYWPTIFHAVDTSHVHEAVACRAYGMNYFHDRITDAICEGINSLVQAAKRKAKGFNTFDGFKTMIFLVGGKLKLDVPSPF